MNAMLKSEREDLQRLVRQREKVLKSAARQRSVELLADFENQMGQEYSFDQDEVWAEAARLTKAIVDKAQEQIKARCREIGIPDRFAPGLEFGWRNRGYENLIAKRRTELRRMAQTQIAVQEQKAAVQIELSCLDAQTNLATAGLTSEAARGFIETCQQSKRLCRPYPSPRSRAVAERLVSSNALRQQRHRERQKALRNATEPLQVAESNGSAE